MFVARLYLLLLVVIFISLNDAWNVKLHSQRRPFCLTMIERDRLPGANPPFGYFDPLGLASNRSDKRLKLWREAEVGSTTII